MRDNKAKSNADTPYFGAWFKAQDFLHQFGAVTHQYLAYVPYKQPNQVQASPADDPKPWFLG